ncbi:unnamed protein product, partial [Prorocentrum cordatum]
MQERELEEAELKSGTARPHIARLRNIMKPALSRGDLQVIGATTIEEYRKYIEKDKALERRFQPVTVPEPTVEETQQILKGLARKYE